MIMLMNISYLRKILEVLKIMMVMMGVDMMSFDILVI